MTTVRVSRRHLASSRPLSAFRSAIPLAIRDAIPGAHLIAVGDGRVSYVLLDGWRLAEHVHVRLPAGVAIFDAALQRGEKVRPFTFELGEAT